LLLACPLGLGVLAWRGYFISSIELSFGLLATLGLMVGADVLYYMLLRWFWIKKRKLELAERLEKWRARQEAEETDGSDEAGGLLNIDPEEEGELDLESVSEQTRDLIRFLFILGALAAIVGLWNGMVPVLSILGSIPIGGALSLLELAKAVIIVIMTWMAVKNLPGVLELSVLRGTSIEAGTRHAISTLCQYALIAIGVVAFSAAIDLDWSKFGWIAAALSVGLGFGLQEVVANFVCGLILLFERPIRVGDVVTLDGTTGTVTRIQMRATTITNWDRQDFVVPNKNLITGTILNWTLTASVNRVVIPVGVAYGTDTEEARSILLDVAAKHPLIMDDPAPLASFEQFADSSLTLILRAYLPNLDNRLGTITELHTEIDRRFAEAGIEIAFPQQDLHIRSGLERLAAEQQGVASGGPFEH
jgi:potassium efflux system protein